MTNNEDHTLIHQVCGRTRFLADSMAAAICDSNRKATRSQGLPEKITIDQSGSNTAAIKRYNRLHRAAIVIRHSKYLNNIVEQDHRAVKRLTRPMLGFKSFWAARCTIAGMDVMHAIRKGQLLCTGVSVHGLNLSWRTS